MLEIRVAHALEPHLESVVVIDAHPVGLAPRPDRREQRASAEVDVGEVTPKLQTESIFDALSDRLACISRQIVVCDHRLLLGVGDTNSHIIASAHLRCIRRLSREKVTNASILGTLRRKHSRTAEMVAQPLGDKRLELEIDKIF